MSAEPVEELGEEYTKLDDWIIAVNPDGTEWTMTNVSNWEADEIYRVAVDGRPLEPVAHLKGTTYVDARRIHVLCLTLKWKAITE